MTDATELDLDAVRETWLNQCGPCDAGLPMECACACADPRPVIERLLAALDEARRLLENVRSARDATGCWDADRCTVYPAPPSSSDADRDAGLSEDERAALTVAFHHEREGVCRDDTCDRGFIAAVERILAARVDEAIGAALIVSAARAQPEGTTRVEWNRLDETGEPTVTEGGWRGYNAKNYGRQMVAEHGGTLIRRTVTEFAPVVGEWESVDTEGGE